jgi:tRNA (adenine37-N6)-methyltransferase
MKLKPIGFIRSKYKKQDEAPRQGRDSQVLNEIIIFDEYIRGLTNIDRYKFLIVLYWLDNADRISLTAIPPGKTKERGVFSTRSPNRPNPIAFCLVEVVNMDKNVLIVKGLDALNKSPVLDIKPFIPEIDCIKSSE